jgi:hypothetical protein
VAENPVKTGYFGAKSLKTQQNCGKAEDFG